MDRALILMTRLSDYMLNCMVAWQESTGADLHIVRRKVDSSAPYLFETNRPGFHFYQREDLSDENLKELARSVNPDMILCFGWLDKGFMSVVKGRSADCPAVMTMDNQWHGTLRQWLGIVYARLKIAPVFDYVWLPGPRQHSFARKLGFSKSAIHEGLLVANDKNFYPIWQGLSGQPPVKRLIFTGRYAPEKGLDVLWDAFADYHEQTNSDLELWCIGTGELEARRPEHPKIRHLGFVQPTQFAEELQGGGIFILPSRFEPWGLVVQEFALAGCPLILSRHVGAVERFLTKENGFLLPEVTRDALVSVFSKVDALSHDELGQMSCSSRKIAEGLTAQDWARQAQAFAQRTV